MEIDVELKYLDRELEQLHKLSKMAKDLADKVEGKSHDEEILRAIMLDMGYKALPPDAKDFAKIEAAFHEHTDRYVRLAAADDGLEAHFSGSPLPTVETAATWERAKPGRSKAHAAAAERGDKAREEQSAPKPPTKAQQRRANAKKGLGLFTDDEVREQKNAARRAARLAKKATTETTTLAGQTDLGV